MPYYTKGGKAQFIERDPFVTIIPLPAEVSGEGAERTTQETTQKTTQKILDAIQAAPSISREEIARTVGITPDGVKYHLKRLQQSGRLRRIGPDKGGHWEVLPGTEKTP